MPVPQKIFIIGISGSGKSTLAKRLSSELGYPHFDLDKARYPHPKKKQPLPAVPDIINDILAHPQWIAEGVYSWTWPLLASADQIIWLDTGAKRSTYRIFKRYITRKLTGHRTFSWGSTLRLASGAWRSNRPHQPHKDDEIPWEHEVEVALKPYMNKVQRVVTAREARIFTFR